MFRLFDTATGEVRPLELRDRGAVSIYLCGPTVYDLPHLGHGRHALVWDVLRRYLEWTGLAVRFVSNITDVDDNIIRRAEQEGRTEAAVAGEFEGAWYDALDALGVLRPTADPHATEYVPQMVELVAELVAREAAYELADGVYLDTGRVPGYGLLARQSLDSLRAGSRVEVDANKRSPLDFVLWKRAKPGEPAWESPFGPGRPGWHTECVVMSLDLLGEGFDLHAGGQDLAFPHHENERAQAVALGRTFARHWSHHAFVVAKGGEKMSKSLGNFTSLSDLLERQDPRAYRLLVLRAHYRSPLEVTPGTIGDAEAGLARLDSLGRRVPPGAPTAPPDAGAIEEFRAAMDDDLDTPKVVAQLFDLVRRANTALDAGADVAGLWAAVLEITGALGLEVARGEPAVAAGVDTLVARRDAARAARDFAAADTARDELVALGYVVEDTPTGTRVRRA